MSYQTNQKQAVFNWICSVKSHPTAKEVFEGVQKTMPNIGFATVYRNLASLVDEGKISELQFKDTSKRYDGYKGKHQHFWCEKCQTIYDMDLTRLLNIKNVVKLVQCHTVEEYNLELCGICANCRVC